MKNGDCHQFAPRHGPRKKVLSLKRIGWLYPFFHGLLAGIFALKIGPVCNGNRDY